MKLSEAMRAGAKLVPQTTGKMFQYEHDEETHLIARVRAACALGCAYLGLHPDAVEHPVYIGIAEQEMNVVWPELIAVAPGWVRMTLGELVASMNDVALHSVEYIADELEATGL